MASAARSRRLGGQLARGALASTMLLRLHPPIPPSPPCTPVDEAVEAAEGGHCTEQGAQFCFGPAERAAPPHRVRAKVVSAKGSTNASVLAWEHWAQMPHILSQS